MGDLRSAVATALDGPDVDATYECNDCGVGYDDWTVDCPDCGGVLTRIVTEVRDDESRIGP